MQGTFETLAAAAEKHFHAGLKHKLTLSAGLGGMGGAQPLAVTMNEGVALIVEVDERRIRRRLETKYLDIWTANIDEAVRLARRAQERGEALSIGLLGNAADTHPELVRRGVIPDIVTDQTSAHDPLSYVPSGLSVAASEELRRSDPAEHSRLARQSMAVHVQAMLEFQRRGAIVFDYGNNLRQQAYNQGVLDAFDYPGFVPAYIRPLFCEGKGPFRWAALSGDPEDIYRTDEAVIREFRR